MAKKQAAITVELDREINENLAISCQKLAQEQEVEQLERKMKAEIDSYRKSCTEGFVHCVDGMQEIAQNDPSIDLALVKTKLNAAFNKLDTIETIKRYVNEVQAGRTWRELLDVPEIVLEALYKGAKQQFEAERYPEAQSAFCFLTTLDSTQYPFWIGFGHSCFQNKKYQEAVNAYAWAVMTSPTALWPHFYAANCFEEMGDKQRAIVALELAKDAYHNSPERNRNFEEAINVRLATLQRK